MKDKGELGGFEKMVWTPNSRGKLIFLEFFELVLRVSRGILAHVPQRREGNAKKYFVAWGQNPSKENSL